MKAITEAEKKDVQEILSHIFGRRAYEWSLNIHVLELLDEHLRKSDSCSRYMDLLPRPYFLGNAIKWASRQARDAVIRHLKNGGKHYLLCLRGVGIGMRTRFQMASMRP